MNNLVSYIGMFVTIVGLILEGVAFAGIAFYPIRRTPPFKSPLQLQALGCLVFYTGALVLIIGQLLG